MADLDKNGYPIDWKKVAIRMWSELTALIYDLREIDRNDRHGLKYKSEMRFLFNHRRKLLKKHFEDHPEELHEKWDLGDFDD